MSQVDPGMEKRRTPLGGRATEESGGGISWTLRRGGRGHISGRTTPNTFFVQRSPRVGLGGSLEGLNRSPCPVRGWRAIITGLMRLGLLCRSQCCLFFFLPAFFFFHTTLRILFVLSYSGESVLVETFRKRALHV